MQIYKYHFCACNGIGAGLKECHIVEACESAVSLADDICTAIFDAIQYICSQHSVNAQERVQALRMSACTTRERTQSYRITKSCRNAAQIVVYLISKLTGEIKQRRRHD